MAIKRHTPVQIIFKLREIDVALSQGKRVVDVHKQVEKIQREAPLFATI